MKPDIPGFFFAPKSLFSYSLIYSVVTTVEHSLINIILASSLAKHPIPYEIITKSNFKLLLHFHTCLSLFKYVSSNW